MTLTLAQLKTRVNLEVENAPSVGTAEAIADGVAISFLIVPVNRMAVAGSVDAYIDGVADVAGTMDYSTGVYTFGSVPAADAELSWEFQYCYWDDDVVEHSIYAAINSLFPALYYSVSEEVTTDGEKYEYTPTTSNIEYIIGMEFSSTGEEPWTAMRSKRWVPYTNGSTKTLRFHDAPQAGTIRLHIVCRPGFIADPAEVPGDDILNVPDRAEDPIVSYAAYYLMSQKLTPRIRADVSAVTKATGGLSPRQMNDAANALYLRHQMQLQQVRMSPWSKL